MTSPGRTGVNTRMTSCLVADIGGTKARFALVKAGRRSLAGASLESHRILRCDDFTGLGAVIEAYLSGLEAARPDYASIAIAGIAQGDAVSLTNRPWRASVEDLRQRFGFRRLEMLNDVAALAYGTRLAAVGQLRTVKPGQPLAAAPRVAVAVGTGLGSAALMPQDDGWRLVPAEAGHVGLAPLGDFERELHQRLATTDGHLAWETALSGAGLLRLHALLGQIQGGAAQSINNARDLVRGAQQGDQRCRETMRIFSGWLGAFSGDAALWSLAESGVFLGGGLLELLDPVLDHEALVQRFTMKGSMSSLMQRIPVYRIDSERWTLLGAAAWLLDSDDSTKTDKP